MHGLKGGFSGGDGIAIIGFVFSKFKDYFTIVHIYPLLISLKMHVLNL
jgi:hypothetical protein